MKTWSMMYLIIWVAFVEILIIIFGGSYTIVVDGIHPVVGLLTLALAYLIYRRVASSTCPNRIKVITRTTFGLAILQGVLGVAVLGITQLGVSGLVGTIIDLLHAAIALAIITQASSSATAYDMWEEGEFSPPLSSVNPPK